MGAWGNGVNMIKISADKGKFIINCPYGMNHLLNGIKNKRWSSKKKCYQVPYSRKVVEELNAIRGPKDWDKQALAFAVEMTEKQLSKSEANRQRESFPASYVFKTSPRDCQTRALNFLWKKTEAALFMKMRCISGDAIIKTHRRGKTQSVNLRDFHRRFHNPHHLFVHSELWKVRALCDGEFRYHTVKDVHYTGQKETVKITLGDGKELVCTPDHKILTLGNKWVEAQHLTPDSEVVTNGMCVYVHSRPDGSPFYIGKASKTKRAMDLRPSTRPNIHHQNIVKKYGKENIEVDIIPCPNEQTAFNLEMWFIRLAKLLKVKLTNATEGGEGTVGKIVSETTRIKIAAANRVRIITDTTREKLKNPSNETRQKLSESSKGHKRWEGKTHSSSALEKLKVLGSKNYKNLDGGVNPISGGRVVILPKSSKVVSVVANQGNPEVAVGETTVEDVIAVVAAAEPGTRLIVRELMGEMVVGC